MWGKKLALAYADPPGDRNRTIEVTYRVRFPPPGGNGRRGCGTRHEGFSSRRSGGKYGVVFAPSRDIRNERGFKHLLFHHRIRSLLLHHRICYFEQGLYEAKKATNIPTSYTANHHQLNPHTRISYLTQPDLQPDSAADTASADNMQQVTYVIGCFATPGSEQNIWFTGGVL